MPLHSHTILFEDVVAQSPTFLPFSYTHAIAELRSGAFSAIERARLHWPEPEITVHTRPILRAIIEERFGIHCNSGKGRKDGVLFLNSRAFLTADSHDILSKLESGNSLWTQEGVLIATRFEALPEAVCDALEAGTPITSELFQDKRSVDGSILLFRSLWELIHHNPRAIARDAELLPSTFPRLNSQRDRVSFAVKPENIFVAKDALMGPGVVLDATDGPIIIMAGARIMPNATIMGPAVICKDSLVKVGAKIYEGTTIGPVCKVGGEIEKSIMLGYSNKQHDGYLGHSYICEWVNLGADTNTSDLKNDYSPVVLSIEGKAYDTHSLFIGLLMGDHSKCSINTQFNTGSVVGVSCNIFGCGFPPKWIPNFSWGGADNKFVQYRIDKAIAVARIVMARRDVVLTEANAALLQSLNDYAENARPNQSRPH